LTALTTLLASVWRSLTQRAGAILRAVVRQKRIITVGAATAAFALFAVMAVAPLTNPSNAQTLESYIDEHAQTVEVAADLPAQVVEQRDGYDATPGIQTLARSGTNYDWAKMVMLFGGWPMSDDNITVFTRWMRQENGPPDWWNRNNPLNNGWGTQGGTFMSGYANLVDAARWCADALNTNPGYAGIRDGFANAKPAAEIEAAIWASPWATGHYANGGHWHYTPVEVVKAPPSAWGL
jgi:hypothetical protein